MHSKTPSFVEESEVLALAFHLMIVFHCNPPSIAKAESLLNGGASSTPKTHVSDAPSISNKIRLISMVTGYRSLYEHLYDLENRFAHVGLPLLSITLPGHWLAVHMELLT